MKAYRPSEHRDAEVSRDLQARRAGPRVHDRKLVQRPFNRKCCTKAKLSDDQIRWVRANWDQTNGGTLSIAEMGRRLNVTASAISQICNGHAWKEIV